MVENEQKSIKTYKKTQINNANPIEHKYELQTQKCQNRNMEPLSWTKK